MPRIQKLVAVSERQWEAIHNLIIECGMNMRDLPKNILDKLEKVLYYTGPENSGASPGCVGSDGIHPTTFEIDIAGNVKGLAPTLSLIKKAGHDLGAE